MTRTRLYDVAVSELWDDPTLVLTAAEIERAVEADRRLMDTDYDPQTIAHSLINHRLAYSQVESVYGLMNLCSLRRRAERFLEEAARRGGEFAAQAAEVREVLPQLDAVIEEIGGRHEAAFGMLADLVSSAQLRRLAQKGVWFMPFEAPVRLVDLPEDLPVLGAGDERREAVITMSIVKAEMEVLRLSAGLNLREVSYDPQTRLFMVEGRWLKAGKAAAALQRKSPFRLYALPAFLEAITELRRVPESEIGVEVYTGAASGIAYAVASASGIHSCMAKPAGAGALAMSSLGLGAANAVLLFHWRGRAVARCKVSVTSCVACGHVFVYADRLYVGHTAVTPVLRRMLTNVADARHEDGPACPACGSSSLVKVVRGVVQPYEDTFSHTPLVGIGGDLAAVCTKGADDVGLIRVRAAHLLEEAVRNPIAQVIANRIPVSAVVGEAGNETRIQGIIDDMHNSGEELHIVDVLEDGPNG